MWKQILAFVLQALGQAALDRGVDKLAADKKEVNKPSGM